MSDNNYPLLMTEQNWANTQLSIARYFGGIKAFGRDRIIELIEQGKTEKELLQLIKTKKL